MLLIEAMWLLGSTTLSIVQIAERLHFADSTTFSRFFRRLKGANPNAYHNKSHPTPDDDPGEKGRGSVPYSEALPRTT